LTDYRRYLRNQSLPGMTERPTAQQRGEPPPPLEKEGPQDAEPIALVPPDAWRIPSIPLESAIRQRRSRRSYTDDPLSIDELSFILWATQGVTRIAGDPPVTLRTVPSGGARHPFETYVAVRNVASIPPGRYRYAATRHALLCLPSRPAGRARPFAEICDGQSFVDPAAAVFIWSARPARTEWRYGDDSLKDLLISAGHICQNLYLACEAIGAGTCAILSYQQALLDELLDLDGWEEMAIYLAPVGKLARR